MMLSALSSLDVRLWQAFIAGAFVAAGWLVNGWQNRRIQQKHRDQRVRDAQIALQAEIRHYVDALGFFDLDEVWREVTLRMERDADYFHAIPTEKNDTVFTALLGEVHILPPAVIGPVVRYYNQVFAIYAVIDDLRAAAEPGSNVSQDQRILMYRDYISLKKEAKLAGQTALDALELALADDPFLARLQKHESRLDQEAAHQAVVASELRHFLNARPVLPRSGTPGHNEQTGSKMLSTQGSSPDADLSGPELAGVS